jgi:hypothetical protein
VNVGGARGSAACTSLLLVALLSGRSAAAQPFVEVASTVGLTMRQHTLPIVDSNLSIYRETYFYSGGVAVGDYDADGDPDIFLTGFGTRDALYQNQGGVFVDVAAQVGLDSMGRSNGAHFVDVDRDGDLDLVVTTVADGAHRLYINRPDSQGDPSFVDEAAARGLSLSDGTPLSGFGVAEGDYDRDGYPDLFVTEWLWEYDHCVRQHSRLLRNRGAEAPGYFEDVTRSAGVWMLDRLKRYPAAFAAAFSDLDDDGLLDLIVVSDFRTSRLFWNRGDGTFEDGTETARVGTAESDMGSTLGDYDGDGDLDWFVSAIYHPNEPGTGNRLFRYDGGRVFTDVTSAEGVLDGGWGWGAAFADFDSDGDLDLVMGSDATDGSRFFRREETGFERVDAQVGLGVRSPGRGLALLDYDGDGDDDFLLTNNGAYPFLYRNDAPAAPYLRVRPTHGDGTPVVGADVWVSGGGRTQRRQIGTNTHYLAQSEPVAHFGVGPDAATVDVSVRFPSGALVQRTNVTPGQTLTVVEPLTTPPASLPVAPLVDCDDDGEADECGPDCDGNGRADSCDILAAPEADCDGSGVLDVCEVSLGLADDCDANGRPDRCDLATGDCNGDGLLDACTTPVTTCQVGGAVTQPTPTEPQRPPTGCSVGGRAPLGSGGPLFVSALTALCLARRRRKPRP